MQFEIIGISRAHFQARARLDVYVELPPACAEEGMCGKLKASMYATLDAAQNFTDDVAESLKELWFVRGRASPCYFYHLSEELSIVIHGDVLPFWVGTMHYYG